MKNIDHHDAIAERVRKLEHRQLPTSGEYASGVTKTVGASGRDYTTIQEACDFFIGKTCRGCYIEVDAGSYTLTSTLRPQGWLGGTVWNGSTWEVPVTLRGDTRDIVGVTYVDNAPMNRSNIANGGSGTCSLTYASATITVTGSTTSPNFATAGLVSGDKCYVLDNSLVWHLYEVQSVSSNQITFTVAVAAVGNTGTALAICPNRWIGINFNGNVLFPRAAALQLRGFTFTNVYSTSGSAMLDYRMLDYIEVRNCLFAGGNQCIRAADSTSGLLLANGGNVGLISANFATANWWRGLYCSYGARGYSNAVIVGHNKTAGTHGGIETYYGSATFSLNSSVIANGQYGLYAWATPFLVSDYISVVNCTTGITAAYHTFIQALSSSGYMSGNTANYSPSSSMAESTTGAWLQFS